MKKVILITTIIMLIISSLSISVFAESANDIPRDILYNPRGIGEYKNYFYHKKIFTDGSQYQRFIAIKEKLVIHVKDSKNRLELTIPSYYYESNLHENSSQEFIYKNPSNDYIIVDSKDQIIELDYGGDVEFIDENDNVIEVPKKGKYALLDVIGDWETGVKITQPRDGFSQAQNDMCRVYYNFKVPVKADSTADDIKIGNSMSDREVISSEFLIHNGYAYGMYVVDGRVGFGTNLIIKVQVKDPYGYIWDDSITINTYSDFVDEDGDGFDDRVSWDNDYWDRGDKATSGISPKGLLKYINGIGDFFKACYAIIPEPILVIITTAFGVMVALAVLRLVL